MDMEDGRCVRRRSARLLAKNSRIFGTGTTSDSEIGDIDEAYDSDGPPMEPMQGEPELPDRDSFEDRDSGEDYDSKRTGFDRGFEPKKIHNVLELDTPEGPARFFVMEWYETSVHEVIPVDLANSKCPDLVIEYYETKIVFGPPLPNTKQNSDDDVQCLD